MADKKVCRSLPAAFASPPLSPSPPAARLQRTALPGLCRSGGRTLPALLRAPLPAPPRPDAALAALRSVGLGFGLAFVVLGANLVMLGQPKPEWSHPASWEPQNRGACPGAARHPSPGVKATRLGVAWWLPAEA